MKTLIAITLGMASVLAYADRFPRLFKKEIVTGTCLVIPAFNADKVRRIEHGPGRLDVVTYHLDYRERTTTLFLWVDGFGQTVHKETVTTDVVKVTRFQMREDEGNEWDLGKKVREYIEDELEPRRCAP